MKLKNRAVVFDAQSMRFEEWNGHLRVNKTNLTKANVCEYWGWEIANHEQYGLQKDKKYRLLRSPKALEEAVKSFAERPIQYVHKAADADKIDNGKVIGTTGSNPSFEFPYITAAITIWDGEYIQRIKDGKQVELSASYAFIPVVESGVFEGQPYDIVMTDIYVDHIALVEQGRAGPDVRVADSKQKPIHFKGKKMAKLNQTGQAIVIALTSAFNSGRANDSNAKDIASIVAKASKSKKSMVPQVVSSLLIGHSIANDEDSGRIEETVKKAMDEDTECKAKDSDDPVDTLDDEEDITPTNVGDAEGANEPPSATDDDDEDDKKKREEERANDAALIEAKVTKQLYEAAEAKEHVKPLVGREWGRVGDSAEQIYVSALESQGVSVPNGAPIPIYQVLVDQTVKLKQQQPRASDSAVISQNDIARFGATRLRRI